MNLSILLTFCVQVFGFVEMNAPDFGDFKVIWLNLPGAFTLHLIERSQVTNLPEGPYSATSPVADPQHLRRGHHICFSISNFDSFVHSLKVRIGMPEINFLFARLNFWGLG